MRKLEPKLLLWPIKKVGDNPVNQSKLEVITRSRYKARENVHARVTIGFGFTSDWLKKWRENFEPITEWSRVRTRLENPWKPLNVESAFSRPWKSLKISALHSWSLKVLRFFFWPAFLIFENFSENNQPFKSCHTNVHYFHACTLRKNEEELYCQTISMGKFIDVNKKEVLEMSKFGPWKSLKSPWIFGLKKCANPGEVIMNQSNSLITFHTQLKTALYVK